MLKKLLFCGLMVSLVLGVGYFGFKQDAVKADTSKPQVKVDYKEKDIHLELKGDFVENDPPGVPEQGRQRRQGTRRTTSTANKPIPKTEAEKKIQQVIDDIYQNQSRGAMIVPATDGRMLRIMAEAVNAQRVVELGTSVGCSGLWFCMALQTTGGELITYEIDRRRAETARQNFKQAGVEDIVTLVEGDAHREITKLKDPIDVIFIDADKEGYLDYFNKLHSLVR
ncbi:O-methyltransferase, partial [Planctomycetota bacterium]